MKLWECFPAPAVDAESQSQVEELIWWSFIQSHWPCITLWPISMFSRILASESIEVPSSHVGQRREANSTTLPPTTSRRCISIMLTMYLRSRSPRSSKTSSWIASNSRPSSSICSSVRRARGLSIIVAMAELDSVVVCLSSESDLDGALGGVDAGAHHLSLAARDLPGAQVADLAGAQLAHARVADAHAASERQRRTGLLARDQDRLRSVAGSLDIAVDEADRPALAALPVTHGVRRLEALHVQAVAVAVGLPMLGHRIEHSFGAADERLAARPVRAQLGERVGRQPPVPAGDLQMQAEPGAAPGQLPELIAEDRVVLGARGVQVDDVVELAAAIEVAQHAHDRGDAAARADEQHAPGQRGGEDETALDAAEPHDRPGLGLAVEEGRDLARLDELGRDADAAVRPPGVGGQRVGAPVMHAVDDHADPQVLAGLVPGPLPARLDVDGRRRGGLALDPLDSPAQLLRGPQRIDQLEVVVGEQRGEQAAQSAQRLALEDRDLRLRAAFSHGARAGRPSVAMYPDVPRFNVATVIMSHGCA